MKNSFFIMIITFMCLSFSAKKPRLYFASTASKNYKTYILQTMLCGQNSYQVGSGVFPGLKVTLSSSSEGLEAYQLSLPSDQVWLHFFKEYGVASISGSIDVGIFYNQSYQGNNLFLLANQIAINSGSSSLREVTWPMKPTLKFGFLNILSTEKERPTSAIQGYFNGPDKLMITSAVGLTMLDVDESPCVLEFVSDPS